MYQITLKNNIPSNLLVNRIAQFFDYNYHFYNISFDRLFNKSVLEGTSLISEVKDSNNKRVSLYDFYLELKRELRDEFSTI